jgi:hypothetical protein
MLEPALTLEVETTKKSAASGLVFKCPVGAVTYRSAQAAVLLRISMNSL